MIFTGERVLPDDPRLRRTYLQSLVAYNFALKYCKGKRVLDLCCGEGYGSSVLSKYAKEVVSLDYNLAAIKAAKLKYKNNKNIKFINSNFIIKLPKLEKFDVIVSYQAIEHFKDLDLYTKRVYSLLKKNGLFIVSTPNKLTTHYGFNPYHYFDFTEAEFRKVLGKRFKNISIFGIFGDKNATNAKNKNEGLTKYVIRMFPEKLISIIPINIQRFFYTIGSTLIKTLTYIKEKKKIDSLTEKSFYVSKSDVKKSLDLLAIAKK